jgi:hypothetical protein
MTLPPADLEPETGNPSDIFIFLFQSVVGEDLVGFVC